MAKNCQIFVLLCVQIVCLNLKREVLFDWPLFENIAILIIKVKLRYRTARDWTFLFVITGIRYNRVLK
jgi:hypothetical protein